MRTSWCVMVELVCSQVVLWCWSIHINREIADSINLSTPTEISLEVLLQNGKSATSGCPSCGTSSFQPVTNLVVASMVGVQISLSRTRLGTENRPVTSNKWPQDFLGEVYISKLQSSLARKFQVVLTACQQQLLNTFVWWKAMFGQSIHLQNCVLR